MVLRTLQFRKGKIAKVQRDIQEEAKEVIDFTGKTLQPGIIDSHVHLGTMWGSHSVRECLQ